jgi:hypothetical protein
MYKNVDLQTVSEQPLMRGGNKSGYQGVRQNKSGWQASINDENLGTFNTAERAAQIYARAKFVEWEKRQTKVSVFLVYLNIL